VRTVQEVVGGKTVTRQVAVTVPIMMERVQKVKAKDLQVSTAGGKKVDVKKLPNFLKKKTCVLISSDGKKVDPAYLEIIKKDTLVLVIPPAIKPAPLTPPDVPPPPRR
jgi:hypothetical protein